jgi:hypothetical protein
MLDNFDVNISQLDSLICFRDDDASDLTVQACDKVVTAKCVACNKSFEYQKSPHGPGLGWKLYCIHRLGNCSDGSEG